MKYVLHAEDVNAVLRYTLVAPCRLRQLIYAPVITLHVLFHIFGCFLSPLVAHKLLVIIMEVSHECFS